VRRMCASWRRRWAMGNASVVRSAWFRGPVPRRTAELLNLSMSATIC
jgi:hypothetical protein